MQAFIDGVSTQCERFGLDTELIIVEWNPPEDNPRLKEVLRLPQGEHFYVRIITVPSSYHKGLSYSNYLGLFQMIAKNVGIRRASGRFVLATNIDILFSNEMVHFIASGRLHEGRYYRADRYDVPSDTPSKGSIDQELEYCKKNLLAVCKKEASYDFRTGEVHRIYSESGGLKRSYAFFWAVGPLFIFDFVRTRVGAKISPMRERKRRYHPPPAPRVSLRIASTWKTIRSKKFNLGTRYPQAKPLKLVDAVVQRFERVSFAVISSISVSRPHHPRRPLLNPRFVQIATDLVTLPPPTRPWLFTNASGDFTLMAKSDWARVHGYAEFQMYSLHVDSLMLYSAYYGGVKETYLRHPIYHIDHLKGWHWSPSRQVVFSMDMIHKGVPVISYPEFLDLTDPMVKKHRSRLFNGPNWGLGDQTLEDTLLPGTGKSNVLTQVSPRANQGMS
jgi:hypothetical protein